MAENKWVTGDFVTPISGAMGPNLYCNYLGPTLCQVIYLLIIHPHDVTPQQNLGLFQPYKWSYGSQLITIVGDQSRRISWPSPLYRQAVRSEMQQLRLADRAEMDQELEHLNRTAAKLPPQN